MTDAEISVQFQNYAVAQFIFGKSRRLHKMKLTGLRITSFFSKCTYSGCFKGDLIAIDY